MARSLGFVGRQVRGTIASQALTIGMVALVIGIPLGLIAGRLAWTITTSQLSVVDHAVIPALAMVAGALSFIVLLLLLAAIPGRRAGTIHPATVLRAE